MSAQSANDAPVTGVEHWTKKGEVRLFLWEKYVDRPDNKPAVLFVHGSSMASQPTFDLKVHGRADSSVMDWFARARLRVLERRHGRLRAFGQEPRHHLRHRQRRRRPGCRDRLHHAARAACRAFLIYGISSGALRAALFAQRHPDRVARLALDAFVWTGEGSPTLEQRRKKLPEFLKTKRRPIDRAFVYSIFERDHPECAERRVVDAFADAILALDSSMPNGTYIDMCSKLPVVDPTAITAPTIIMRGEFDGIAGVDDLMNFFVRLPNPDKQFTVMPGISHASFQQKNYLLVYHILHSFFDRPDLAYTDAASQRRSDAALDTR